MLDMLTIALLSSRTNRSAKKCLRRLTVNKFTQEAEEDDSLPLLDVLVRRKDNKFLISIYRKTTLTGQYVNF